MPQAQREELASQHAMLQGHIKRLGQHSIG